MAGIPRCRRFPIPTPFRNSRFRRRRYDASYGRNAGANVNVVTKSGTNDYHGTAFEFFRNSVLNANDWFLRIEAAVPRGVLNQNQYGGVFGGPVKKDKLFFFVSYQQTWQKNGLSASGESTGIALPPIPAGNRGTCPATGVVTIAQMESSCDAATQTFVAALGAATCSANHPGVSQDVPFHGGVNLNCSGNNISPQAIQILQLKLPNGNYYVPSSGTANYLTGQSISDPALYKEYQAIGNWDYLINSKNTLSGRYFVLTNPAAIPFPPFTNYGYLAGTPETTEFGNMVSMLRLTSTISNNLVNEARISYYRNTTTINMPLNFRNSQLGVTGLSPGGPFDVMPEIVINNLFTMGYQLQQYQSVAENTPSVSDQISWTHEKHTIRTGFEWTHTHYKWFQPSYQIGEMQADTFADFLLGLPGCATVNAACTASAASAQAGGAGVLPASYSPLGTSTNGTAFSNIDNIGVPTDRSDPTGLASLFLFEQPRCLRSGRLQD